MSPEVKLALEYAARLAEQIITLTTGVIGVSITFMKDFIGKAPKNTKKYIKISWFIYLVSLIFGIWTLMAITGTIEAAQNSIGGPVKLPAALQIITFLIGTVFLIVFGVTVNINDD